MIVSPEMRSLRNMLSAQGVEYATDDSEYGIACDGDEPEVVDVENAMEGRLLDGFTHVERTEFRSTDGRAFLVSYIWTRDDDDRKVFCSMHGELGYLEVVVGDDAPYSAYSEDVVEDALCHARYEC